MSPAGQHDGSRIVPSNRGGGVPVEREVHDPLLKLRARMNVPRAREQIADVGKLMRILGSRQQVVAEIVYFREEGRGAERPSLLSRSPLGEAR